MNLCEVFFDLEQQKRELAQKKDEMHSNPKFWDDPTISARALKEQKHLEKQIESANALVTCYDDLSAAAALYAEDEEFAEEACALLERFEQLIEHHKMAALLNEEHDAQSAWLSVQPGAGGTESCDWAAMLWRMYHKFCHKMNYTLDVISYQSGEEAGIKSVTCKITGDYAYGRLRTETGVHRLIRISPFDSGGRRHTSFASVDVTPYIEDTIEVNIQSKDLRIDTFRASGAGGQHVNKTDSAVRITHIPTGIVVQSQSQRSQHQNREQCMQLLTSKLYTYEKNQRDAATTQNASAKADISFGSQIRTYTLHPFKLIKDHRSLYESSHTSRILDGDLTDMITHSLQSAKLQRDADNEK